MADDEKISVTRSELADIVKKAVDGEKMDPAEKKARSMIREEIASVLGEFFTFDEDDEKKAKETSAGFGGLFGGGE